MGHNKRDHFFLLKSRWLAYTGAGMVFFSASAFAMRIESGAILKIQGAYTFDDSDISKSALTYSPEFFLNTGTSSRLKSSFKFAADYSDQLIPGKRNQQERSGTNKIVSLGNTYEIELRELYLESYLQDIYLRIGKQQLVWGSVDGFRVLDIVNPYDYHEFILKDPEEIRIPTMAINMETPAWNGMLQLIMLSDTTYDDVSEDGRFAPAALAELHRLSSTGMITLEKAKKPENDFASVEYGLQYSAFLYGWDLTLNYLNHYYDEAVYQSSLTDDKLTVTPSYERTHTMGSSFSNSLGSVVFRGEFAYHATRYFLGTNSNKNLHYAQSDEARGVLALDWTTPNNILLSMQLFQSQAFKNTKSIVRSSRINEISMLVEKSFMNNSISSQTFYVHDLTNNNGLLSSQLKYDLTTNITLITQMDIFYGENSGTYGQFKKQDRILLSFEVSL